MDAMTTFKACLAVVHATKVQAKTEAELRRERLVQAFAPLREVVLELHRGGVLVKNYSNDAQHLLSHQVPAERLGESAYRGPYVTSNGNIYASTGYDKDGNIVYAVGLEGSSHEFTNVEEACFALIQLIAKHTYESNNGK